MNLLTETKRNRQSIELDKIINRVNDVNCVDIRIKGRKKEVVYARKMYSHIAYQKGYSYTTIAERLNMTHASILHHRNDSEWLLENDEHFKSAYLLCQGKPVLKNIGRDFFDLSIAKYTQKGFEI